MKTAVMISSYAGDFDRCALLCESMDRLMRGDWRHHILVERKDAKLFRKLESPKRNCSRHGCVHFPIL